MNNQRLNEYITHVRHYLSARRLKPAFDVTAQLLGEVGAPWAMRQRLEELRDQYNLLARYALDGASDPHRQEVYDGIVGGIIDLLGAAAREVKYVSDPDMYYSQLRYERMHPELTISALIEQVRHCADNVQMALLTGEKGSEGVRTTRLELERAATRLFNRVWVTMPLATDDADTLSTFLADDSADRDTRLLIVSALLLNLLHAFDKRALYVLLKAYYDTTDTDLQMRALCAYLIALSLYRTRNGGKHLRDLQATVAEMPRWGEDVRMAFLQFIRTRDTEKINRKMQDELIPQMLKLRPDIYKKISENPDELIGGSDSGDENPEWEELLEKSGIADKMRELQELQEDGADVMMGTFAHLKSYRFFNDPANWFLPYTTLHTELSGAGDMAEILEVSAFLCDSDRYSVALSLGSMPQAQRDMLKRQFDMQNINMAEIRNASLSNSADDRRGATARYVQNLYRFFKLFRRKGEFTDPFATALNLALVPSLADVIDDAEHLQMIAGFYFKRGYYADALELYKRMPDTPKLRTSELYQQMGYCLQHAEQPDPEGALRYYRQAEMLSPDNVWTLRRMGSLLRTLGRYDEAIERYERLCSLRPDDLSAAMQLGHTYMEAGRYKEALKQYFKVEYLDHKSVRAIRPIAWCSFLAADYERAADYYGRIPADTLTATDYLNRGHLAMATGRYRDAVELYRKSMELDGGDRSAFASAMQADLHHLRNAGVSDLMTGLVLDEM